MKSKIYYAHSKIIYNTLQEEEERKFLEKKFGKIICPNRDIGELGRIEPYLDIIKKCRRVISSEYHGHIGRGVYKEIKTALKLKKNVLCLKKLSSTFRLFEVSSIEIVDEFDWKICYGKINIVKSERG